MLSNDESFQTLPENLDAERFCLGLILKDATALDRIGPLLQPADFTLDKHQRIFARILDMAERGETVDRVTLADELFRRKQLKEAGGLAYLLSLEDGMPQLADVARYAQIVKEKSTLRSIISLSEQAREAAQFEDRDAAGIASDIAERMAALARSEDPGDGLVPIQDIVERHGANALLDPGNPHFQKKGLPTGFVKFDEMTGGLREGELIILAARPAMGKAQPLSSLVKTPSGWVPMGDLAVGDPLASIDGSPSMVTGVFPQGEKEVFRVNFVDGRTVECCDEHLWRVTHRHWPEKWRVLSTQQLRCLLKSVRNKRRISIDLISGDFGDQSELPLNPWLLGVLLGDGGITRRAHITSADEDILERIRRSLPDYVLRPRSTDDPYSYRIQHRDGRGRPNAIWRALSALGLAGKTSHQKFIPRAYLNASKEQRLDLLRGLIDTDGTVEESGTIRYSTVSPQLALDFQELVWSLGGICRLRRRSNSFTLSIRHKTVDAFVWLPRKRVRLRPSQYANNLRAVIESIEPAGSAVCQCISVSHPSHLYITDGYIATHNTALALNMAYNVAMNKTNPKAVAIFSFEMSKESLLSRLLCASAMVDQQRYRAGYLNADERNSLAQAMSALMQAPIFIDDTAGTVLLDVHSKLRTLQRDHDLGLVVIDYLQLMQGRGRFENRVQEISSLTRGFKLMSKELRVPMLVLSQLSRSPETRPGDHRPMLSDLRESGSIEQDADMVGFIFREEVYRPDKESLKGKAELILAKQRNGPIGKIQLAYLNCFTKFENCANYDEEPVNAYRPSAPPPPDLFTTPFDDDSEYMQ